MAEMSISAGRMGIRSSRLTSSERTSGRSVWEALLWGAARETCAECGVEVKAGTAYRVSSRQVYCSLAHAQLDQLG